MIKIIDVHIKHRSWWWLIPAWGVLMLGLYQAESPGPLWMRLAVLAAFIHVYWRLRDKAPMWPFLCKKREPTPEEAAAEMAVLRNEVLPEGWRWGPASAWRFDLDGSVYYPAYRYRHADIDGELELVKESEYFTAEGRPLKPPTTTTDMMRSGLRRDL